MKYKARFLVIIIFLVHVEIFGQGTVSNDHFISTAIDNTKAAYQQSLGINAGVYNGIFYSGYDFRFNEGHPYYNSVAFSKGWVIYEGIRYDSILMQYDEVIDEVIAINNSGKMRLWTPRVSAFSIFDNVFVSLKKNEKTDSAASSRYYRLLYKGNMTVVDKERKEIKEIIPNMELQHYIVSKTAYYIIKNGEWFSINSKKSFFKLVSDHKDEVKAFVKKNKLNFKKDRSNMLAKAVAYYETLR